MTPSQIAALQELTSRVDRVCRYSTRDGYMDGPMVSLIAHVFDNGTVQISINNITDEHEWFMTTIHVIAHVTPRGKVTIRLHTGLTRSLIDNTYFAAKMRRQRRNAKKRAA